jgi:UDP-glucose 4-epimerase
MKILVTGGAGFIGSHVVDAYIDASHDVLIMDNLSSGKRENLNSKARFYECDIRSKEAVEIIADERPEVLNHHAAQMSVPASVEDPGFDADVNIRGFLNLLQASVAHSVKKVIFISSGGAIYGEATEYPTSEDYSPRPLSPYAITKYASEHYLNFYNNQYGLNYTVLRYANVYGPRQIPHGEAGVVAIFMDRLLLGKGCALYHFEDEVRGMTRDYCFVGDIAKANLAALTAGDKEAVNIGTGTPTHTEDLFNQVFTGMSSRITSMDKTLGILKRGPARAGDIKQSCLNAAKAREVLGWNAEVALKEGIEKTLDWRLGR